MQSGRVAADIGVFVLKTLVTINGGALIALLALYPQVDRIARIRAVIPDASEWFVCGLVAAVISSILAYFFQFASTATAAKMENSSHFCWATSLMLWSALALLVSVVISFVSFVWGLLTMVEAFNA